MARRSHGPGTRAVHAGLPAAHDGAPFLPGPELAAPYHLAGSADASAYGYGRYANRSWNQLEDAIGELEGGDTLVFGSGMAATAALLVQLKAGQTLVVTDDGYPGARRIAKERLEPRGVEVRLVPTDTVAIVEACPGADVVWVETPSNPRLDVCDIELVARAAHAAGAILAVDNTTPTPLGQTPLALGADVVVASATKSLSGHSDLLLGYVATTDAAVHAEVRSWRDLTGAIAGPFEAWLAHRSIATADLRLARQSESSQALAEMLRVRPEVTDVCHPSFHAVAVRQMRRFGPLLGFALRDAAAAQRFLASAELVAEATSFGGIHTTAERRGRWGTDDVPEGFIRFSCGIEDTEDLLADVRSALDRI
jgi:cystathionine gamma-lyase